MGIKGNEEVNRLANEAIKNNNIEIIDNYSIWQTIWDETSKLKENKRFQLPEKTKLSSTVYELDTPY